MTRRDPEALDRLGSALAPAARRVQRAATAARLARSLAVAVRAVPRLSLWVGLLALGLWSVATLPAWLPACAALGLAALVFGRALRAQAGPAAGLAEGAFACDRANGNHDRLTAACELAAAPAAGPGLGDALARAAIADGVRSLQRIDLQRLSLPAPAGRPAWFGAAACLAGLAVLPFVLPHAASGPGSGPEAGARRGTAVTEASAPPAAAPGERAAVELPGPARRETDAERRDAGRKGSTVPPPAAPAAPAPAVPAASGQGSSGSDAAGDSSQSGAPKQAPAGETGSGQSGGGQGSSASGAPDPSPSQQQPKVPGRPKQPKPPRRDPQQEGRPGESAGAPSGPARGSGRLSAVGNKRSDQHRGQERDDDPEVEDEPIEDESSEQEQRGGVMPMRRGDDRPAARELSISGDGPPDQGRGGPTPPKKARGTASLVLGLRLPDSVRGQPNPGTAKTTLEQIPPRPSDGDPGLARAVPAGRPTTPQSQRPPGPFAALQQAYHALWRARDAHPPTPAPPAGARDPR